MISSFVNSKCYLVDCNGRWRLLENTDQFSSCDVTLSQSSLSCGNSKRSSVGRTIVQSHEPWDPAVSGNNEGRLKPPFADNAGIPLAGARRLKPFPRQSRHCESGHLEQMSTLCCYKVKASACSGNQRFLT